MKLVSSLWALATALPLSTLAAQDTCKLVESSTKVQLYRRFALAYTAEQNDYWSTACGALKPSCILYPKSTEEVSQIVSILKGTGETFAIKSGGHNPNDYFSSVDGGPLISTDKLNEVKLDKKAGTVRVGPGNRWDDVLGALDGTGFTAVGGRIGNVGVGGFLLGGGLSFLTAQYGWAANSVLEYEIVLANGTAVTASKTQNTDLFAALRGGGNNFGIVTSFLLQAYPQGQIWGGTMTFTDSPAKASALLKAVRDFTEYCDDDKAALILTSVKVIGLVDVWVMFAFYDGPSPPDWVFANFTAAGTLTNTCKTQSYASLLSANNVGVVKGSVYSIGTETMPLPSSQNGAEVMGAFHSHWRSVAGSVGLVPGVIANVAYQPFSKRMARVARAKGGDIMDIDDDVDRIIIELNYSYLFKLNRDQMDKAMVETYDGFRKLVQQFQGKGKLPEAYLPLFMNDGYYRQDVFGRLRPAQRSLAQSVAAQVDPQGMWRTRTGGFKP